MAVDPALAAIIAGIGPVPEMDFAKLTLAEALALQRAGRTPPDVGDRGVRCEDVSIPGPDGALAARIYFPDHPGPYGAILHLHGGGWVAGSVAADNLRCHLLAKASGILIVSLEYRLAPETRFPGPLEDSYAALAWLHTNAARLDIAPARIGISGSSAGGNLAAALAMLARDRGGPAIAFQLLTYPVCDSRMDTPSYRANATGYFLPAHRMAWFWDLYLRDAADRVNPLASPCHATDLAGLPPAHIITAAYDPLRDEAETYGAMLRQAGVPASVTRYDGMVHGFLSLSLDLPASQAALRETAERLRAALGGQQPTGGTMHG